jgi:hypothetical protein
MEGKPKVTIHVYGETPLEAQKREELDRILEEANKEGNKAKEAYVYMQWTKDRLHDRLGIDNLSTIEGVRLRQIVQRCMEHQRVDAELNVSGINTIEIDHEAAAIWLWELYGVEEKNIHKDYYVRDLNTGNGSKYWIETMQSTTP